MSQFLEEVAERGDGQVETSRAEMLPIAKKMHAWRIAAAAGAVFVIGLILLSFARNEQFNWPVVLEYMFHERVMQGLWMTLRLTVASMVLSLVLAVVLANMRLSPNPVLRTLSWLYVWFFRGIPLLVLIILMFNFALLYPEIKPGIPGLPPLFAVPSEEILSPFWAAVAAFVLHQSAYSSEVIRSSIMSVPKGQIEAAESLGMTHGRTLRRVVLPQAMRIAIPPIANDSIIVLKSTSLVAFIAVSDLLYSVQQIYARNYQIIPLLVVATLWYIAIVSAMSLGQARLERRYGRGVTRLNSNSRNSGK